MQKISRKVLLKAPVPHSHLSNLRDQYTSGCLTHKDFEGRVFQTLLDDFKQFNLFNHDQEAFFDCLVWLYPRLIIAIDTYKDIGSSFDAYICSFVRLAAKEYRVCEFNHHITEYAYWEARAKEAGESDTTLVEATFEVMEVFKPVNNPRQVIILILKSYCVITEESVRRMSPAIGMSMKQLTNMLDKIRELRSKKDDRIHKLQERMYYYFYCYVTYRKKLEVIPEDFARRETCHECMNKVLEHHARLKQQLGSISRQASNQQVAEVLGIPQGTVDSALSAIKRKAGREGYKLGSVHTR
ncbi:MAG: hypothetical protein LBJ41_11520 [Treponema sp.]|jgi:hypothetical protein|nr:hypothetical protein [Treponema sp.]